MARNPFTDDSFPQGKLNRNSFDLSRRSVFTTDFFKLYPYLCQEVLPGDSFEIDARIGIRGMPTVFPVQTRVRMSTEFYYVRNRTLMKNKEWEDFVFKNKDIVLPWLQLNSSRAKQMISTGSLGDALGVPTTIGNGSRSNFTLHFSPAFFDSNRPLSIPASLDLAEEIFSIGKVPYVISDSSFQQVFSTHFNVNAYSSFRYSDLITYPFSSPSDLSFSFSDPLSDSAPVSLPRFLSGVMTSSGEVLFVKRTPLTLSGSQSGNIFVGSSECLSFINDLFSKNSDSKGYRLFIVYAYSNDVNGQFYNGTRGDSDSYYVFWPNDSLAFADSSVHPYLEYVFEDSFNVFSIFDSTDDSFIASNPFVGEDPAIRLSALKFRAYEQVTNYYYVNEKNNPLVFNGQVEYNEFLPSYDAGPDTNVYDFHYRNWELDQYTSALQTPQMGEAPLVGVIFTGDKTADLTFQGSLDDETPSDIKVTVGLDDDDNVEQILDFPSEMPSADLQRLQQRIQAGFSINQFRVTNSFQRFLENSLFRGRRYRNQMKSHHRVSVDFPDIDIPQYIGGASSIMDVGQVTNMADSPNAGLGDYIGTLQGGVSTRNKIRCYCPEHGFILAIVSFCPIPSYAQAIDKSLIKRDALDYFNPEFGKIGFVPVRYSELSPLQTPVGGTVHDVFGYQKAWYEYMAALDEVHGDFRTTLSPFVLTRTFAERPQLSSSFTVGSPEQLNDIFVTQNIVDAYNSSAKFLASAEINIKALRQIPIVGTPSLE